MPPALPSPLGCLDDYLSALGTPLPIWDDSDTPTRHSRAYDIRVGSLTHAVLGETVPLVQGLSLIDAAPLIQAAIHRLISVPGRLAAARVRIAGMSAVYVRDYLPPRPTAFLGAETAVGRGRVDLCWNDPNLGVFFDEIKTFRQTPTHLDRPTAAQIDRYLEAGRQSYGDRFAGVRLLTLANRHASKHVTPDGSFMPLAESRLEYAHN